MRRACLVDERPRPLRESIRARANLVAVLDMDLTVGGRPLPGGRDRDPGRHRAKRRFDTLADCRKEQRGIVVAGYDDDAIRSRLREAGQRVDLGDVRREHPLHACERIYFGTPERRVVVETIGFQ